MSDEELIQFGKMERTLAEPRVLSGVDFWQEQLRLAREGWQKAFELAVIISNDSDFAESQRIVKNVLKLQVGIFPICDDVGQFFKPAEWGS